MRFGEEYVRTKSGRHRDKPYTTNLDVARAFKMDWCYCYGDTSTQRVFGLVQVNLPYTRVYSESYVTFDQKEDPKCHCPNANGLGKPMDTRQLRQEYYLVGKGRTNTFQKESEPFVPSRSPAHRASSSSTSSYYAMRNCLRSSTA